MLGTGHGAPQITSVHSGNYCVPGGSKSLGLAAWWHLEPVMQETGRRQLIQAPLCLLRVLRVSGAIKSKGPLSEHPVAPEQKHSTEQKGLFSRFFSGQRLKRLKKQRISCGLVPMMLEILWNFPSNFIVIPPVCAELQSGVGWQGSTPMQKGTCVIMRVCLCVQILTLMLLSCVPIGKAHNLPDPQFLFGKDIKCHQLNPFPGLNEIRNRPQSVQSLVTVGPL